MKLSIITINYNNAEGLRKTLASVASQTYRNIEHIIVDGGSTDGSVEVIKEYVRNVERMNVERMNECTNVRFTDVRCTKGKSGVCRFLNDGLSRACGTK